MHGSMVEFRAEVKGNINSLKEDLNALNNSVSNLSVCLQEHKKQSETELADLHTELADLHTALANTANHTRLLNIKMDSLEECLSEHKEQVTGKLNALQTSQANHTSQVEKIQDDVTYLKIIHGPYTCGGTGGWRRAIYLDMTNPNTTCPSGWNMTEYSKRTCGRATDEHNTCDSATFPVRGGEYTRICGRIRAYQWGGTDAFARYFRQKAITIDGVYVDGVSVTHGKPRNHIWTFAAGVSESNPTSSSVCPCDAINDKAVAAFVGKDYFCESGYNAPWPGGYHALYPNDTLWDGEDCLPSSTCCSQRNPPYFVKQLPNSTTDDIEARICLDDVLLDENIAVELFELYVQ